MAEKSCILVINPGSTSTKVGIYSGEKIILSHSLKHDVEEIQKFETIYDQKNMRIELIIQWLKDKDINIKDFQCVVGRGGLLRSIPGGTYEVTEKMLQDLRIGVQGKHASNLGGIIAYNIAKRIGVPSYIVDPVSVDEICEEARISGLPEIPRRSLLHALNMKSVIRHVCKKRNLDFFKSSFVVAHLGGGISISPFKDGKLIDCNNASQEGPFSPDRSGTLPVGQVVELAFSGKYSAKQLSKKVMGQGGLIAYIGTNDGKAVDKLIDEGNKKVELIFKAMAYQISKEISAMATVLKGKVDAIIITGGLAYNHKLMNWIKEYVGFIGKIELVPGENELLSLGEGAKRVLKGEEKAKIYEKEILS